MMNRTITCGALVAPWLLLCLATASYAGDGQISLEQLGHDDLKEIADWTERRSNLQPAGQLPRIEYRSAAELSAFRHGAMSVSNRGELVALYDSGTGTILLSNEWRGPEQAARSVIVHEMIHHLQHENGKLFACPAEQEEQAFAIQEAWLAEHGTTLEAEFGIDPFTRLVAGLCLY